MTSVHSLNAPELASCCYDLCAPAGKVRSALASEQSESVRQLLDVVDSFHQEIVATAIARVGARVAGSASTATLRRGRPAFTFSSAQRTASLKERGRVGQRSAGI
jgi:hypothetical protein